MKLVSIIALIFLWSYPAHAEWKVRPDDTPAEMRKILGQIDMEERIIPDACPRGKYDGVDIRAQCLETARARLNDKRGNGKPHFAIYALYYGCLSFDWRAGSKGTESSDDYEYVVQCFDSGMRSIKGNVGRKTNCRKIPKKKAYADIYSTCIERHFAYKIHNYCKLGGNTVRIRGDIYTCYMQRVPDILTNAYGVEWRPDPQYFSTANAKAYQRWLDGKKEINAIRRN